MNDKNTVKLEWVCSEGRVKEYTAKIAGDGGKVVGTTHFVPEPGEADLYSDAQFDPLVVVATVLTAGMVFRYLREMVLDLKGREVAIVDLSKETPQVRVVPVGKVSQVILKKPDGSVERFSLSEVDKMEKNLAAMLPK